MLRRTLSTFTVLLTTGLLLSACQTTKHVAATADEVTAQISGNWNGYFINKKGRRYPLSFQLKNNNGRITGTGNIPSSSHDKTPSLTGTIQLNKVKWTTSANFTYHLQMSKDETGTYHLSGPVTGPNHGRLEATKAR